MEAFLREQLCDYTFFGVGRSDGKRRGEMCGVFFKTARFEWLDGGHFWLTTTPEKPGSRGWGAIFPHMVTWVKLRPRDGGPTFCWFNTHFDAFSGRARAESAKLLRDRIVQIAGSTPWVVTGDFNTGPASRALPHAASGAVTDGVFAARRFPRRPSCRHAQGRDSSSLHRLDWRPAHGLDPSQLAFPDHRCRDRPYPRTRRLPLGPLSGDRDAPSPSHHRTVTADLARLKDFNEICSKSRKLANESKTFQAPLAGVYGPFVNNNMAFVTLKSFRRTVS